MNDQLARAQTLINEGLKSEAARILLPIVRANPRNAEAWWLLATAMTDVNKARYALEQALAIRPDDLRARQMLDRLNSWSGGGSPVQSIPASDDFARAAQSMQRDMEREIDDDDDIFAGMDTRRTAPGQSVSFPVTSGLSEAYTTSSNPAEFDPFAVFDADGKPKRNLSVNASPPIYVPGLPQNTRRSGCANPCLVILALIGGIVVLACAAVVIFAATGGAQMLNIVTDALEQVDGGTLAAEFRTAIESGNFNLDDLGSFSTNPGDNSLLPTGLNGFGELQYGDSPNDTLSSERDNFYTFVGSAGDEVEITLTSTEISGYDPLLMLYSPQNRQIARNDDIGGGNFDSRIRFTLPGDGKYTIVVSEFGAGGGGYVLALNLR